MENNTSRSFTCQFTFANEHAGIIKKVIWRLRGVPDQSNDRLGTTQTIVPLCDRRSTTTINSVLHPLRSHQYLIWGWLWFVEFNLDILRRTYALYKSMRCGHKISTNKKYHSNDL